MRAYQEAYLSDVVENQGKLFDLAAQNYPQKDTVDFINAYMASKTRKNIDESQAYVNTMSAAELWDYFRKTEGYQLKEGKALEGFLPDWIGEFYAYYQWYYNIPSSEVVKKVPVELSDIRTEYRPGYGTFEKVRIIPSQVKIIGTPEEVSAVDAVQLPPLSYRGLSAPVEDTVVLPLPDGLRHARIEPERVVVAFSVKPYTEGEMTLAIRAVNVPRGYKVKFFPSKVKVRYRVSVDDYPRLSESDFSITADMSHTDPSSRIIYPKAVSFAPFVGQVTIMPERVEYLYRKE